MFNDNSNEEKPLYLDYTKSFEERVKDLVSRMTLEEKISQMFNTAQEIPRSDFGIQKNFSKRF